MKRLLAALILAALVACGSTEPADEFSGAYDLATINGQPLPYTTTVADIGSTTETGLLVISPKGKWSLATSGSIQIGTQPPSINASIVNGTWRADGATLTLLSDNAPYILTAIYSAGTITMNLAVYKRR